MKSRYLDRVAGALPAHQAGRIVGKTTSDAFDYRIAKPVAIAAIDNHENPDLIGLKVDVYIVRGQNAGTITLAAAWDLDGASLRPGPDKS